MSALANAGYEAMHKAFKIAQKHGFYNVTYGILLDAAKVAISAEDALRNSSELKRHHRMLVASELQDSKMADLRESP